jgi:hypothetical protein
MQLWDGALWHTIWVWVQASGSLVALPSGVLSWYVFRSHERYKASLNANNERYKTALTANMMEKLARVKGEVHVDAEKAVYMQKVQFDI